MGGSQRIFPIAKALCDVTATDDLDGGRGLSPMSGAAPEIGRQLIQAVACVFFRKSAVLHPVFFWQCAARTNSLRQNFAHLLLYPWAHLLNDS